MDPVTDQDIPQDDLVINDDGSVDIPDDELTPQSTGEFQENLADFISESVLLEVGRELCESIDRDKKAREKRDKQYQDGLRRTGLGNDAPGGADFTGASEVVHPALAEACVEFEARAIKELFPPQGPVKTSTVGNLNEQQLDRAERKRTFMNWQLTTQMQEYRSELEQLLTQLPLGGSQFQKFYHDDRFKRPVSEFVPIDDILIPFAATSFYTAERVTHVQHITQSEYEKRIKSGLYRDVADAKVIPGMLAERSASAEANDKIEGREEDAYNEDGLRDVYETYCWQLFDEETLGQLDEPVPYIITTDAHSERVLAIYRNWEEDDELCVKLDWIVEWKFIPWRGAYAIGFPQLIGGLSAAATGALRALLDSAHINNSAALVKLKGTRTPGQNVTVGITGITEIDAPAGVDDIRKLMMPMPYNQPSPILFQLLGWLTNAAKDVVRTADAAIANAGDRTPVGTTQAMIEQGSMIYSAIHARLHESQKRSLQILCRINKTWLNEREEIEDLGKLVISRQDFVGSLDVIPVSDPAIFSEAQRYAQNQSLQQMQQQDMQDPSIPWNKVAIRRRVLKQMRIDNVDEILPLPPKPVTADPIAEVIAAFAGQPIKVGPQQDHLSHMQAHLLYLSNPLILQNPLVQGPPCMAILGHVQEHLMMYHNINISHTAQMLVQQSGGQITPDQAMAAAVAQTAAPLMQTLSPFVQRIVELQKQIQAKMPPPQMPPEIQATIEIAKMDTVRKQKYDEATIQFKEAEQSAKQQLAQTQLALDAAQQRFEQMIEGQRVSIEEQNNKLTAQVDLMNNRADNTQSQITELLKNRDDNETKMQIAVRAGFEKMQQTMQQASAQPQTNNAAELTPHIEKMQALLDQMNQSKTSDALATVMQGLQATIQAVGQPRRTTLEHDAAGRPIGAVSTVG